MSKIVLASASPRRKDLLQLADIHFEVMVADTDEAILPGMGYKEAVAHIALQKALAVQPNLSFNDIIIAADTVVVINDTIIGKPKDRQDAIHILTQLQNAVHTVITAVCIMRGDETIAFTEATEVSFYPLTPEQIIYYVDKYQPFDKAGAYAIQEWIGVVGIAAINGDYYNVMGLPVSKLVQALQQLETVGNK